ncbi:kinase-interacting protein 1-like [Salvia splendens]|uniref:kinase-interacting protein 1-like n=1 Tax=Salvia splendens TaxID=180675 RepID=UPI001C272F0C|nr:kinase-interacting protein 1-like [Salvia splendens]
MLQRAANHAYSWWWASHIRTKQSKWLEQSLQDMEEKVQGMLQLIEGDGDSFAKRAEMYYKRRPELICAVEEAFKVFRSLADRYDLLSKDFQNANNTIATVFPEQVQFGMADDEEIPPKIPDNFVIPDTNMSKIPKPPVMDLKTIISKASKQFQSKKVKNQSRLKSVVESGLTKEEALEEINRLQKEILSLHTVKEFVKSSFEGGIARYWGIESQVMEMQQKICRLQDEFSMDSVIEDDEARTLMAEAALKSCQETLAMLQEKQDKTSLEAKDEYDRIQAACGRLKSLREKYMLEQSDGAERPGNLSHEFSKDVAALLQETKELEELPEKLEESLDTGSLSSLSVTQLAEKIDLLVNKVITLETAVSSQTVLVNTLRAENDELNVQIQSLEEVEEDGSLGGDTEGLSSKVIQMEEKLNKVQDLNKNVESRNNTLQTNFAKAKTSIDTLAEKLTSVKVEDDLEASSSEPDGVVAAPTSSLDDVKANAEEVTSVEVDEVADSFADADDSLLTDAETGEEVGRSSEVDEQGVDVDRALSRELTSDEVEEREDDVGRTSESLATREVGEEEEEVFKDVREVHSVEQGVNKVRRSFTSVQEKEHNENMVRKTSSFSSRKTIMEILEEDSEGRAKEKDKDKGKDKDKDKDDISWQQVLLCGMEDREKILLKEYTTILRNYKEVKKKLNEVERKERDSQFDTTIQMRELKKAISRRDDEITNLRMRLSTLEGDTAPLSTISEEDETFQSGENEDISVTKDIRGPPLTDETNETGMVYLASALSQVEEKLRTDIDAILDENLDFWFRFSTAFHQIQKFKTEVRDLDEEMSKLRERRKTDNGDTQIKSEVVPIFKHLRDIQRELSVWLEQSAPLRDELKNRFTSLCNIQEEITEALREGVETRFSSHQAAKLQGEVLNMKQENEKVREELEVGLDHVSMLQLQIDKTLGLLDQEFGISEQSENRNKVPLRSFIFGNKSSKKPKVSLFSCMHPSRKYQVLRAGLRLSSHNNSSS